MLRGAALFSSLHRVPLIFSSNALNREILSEINLFGDVLPQLVVVLLSSKSFKSVSEFAHGKSDPVT